MTVRICRVVGNTEVWRIGDREARLRAMKLPNGRQYVSPLVANDPESFFLEIRVSHQGEEKLTNRQREVLQLLAEGRSMKEVGYILKLTHRTVAFHKYRLKDRLGLRTNSELVQFAIREHIISPRT